MLTTTKGIVFHHFKYGERGVIAKIYTEKFGLLSFSINNSKSSKSKNKNAYLQPLSLVEINFLHKESKGIHSIKSIHLDIPFSSIPFSINKSSITFFISEVLYKSIIEEEVNPKLFNFLYHSFQILDLKKNNSSLFHIIFLIQLTKYLGFYPRKGDVNIDAQLFFNLQEGCFLNHKPINQLYLSSPNSNHFLNLLGINFDTNDDMPYLNSNNRKILLNTILDYYNLHLSNFGTLKSLPILEDLLH